MNKKLEKINYLFESQKLFQKLLGNEVPQDNPELFLHHLFSLIVEAGEAAQEDKRWKKNGRNSHYNKQKKIEELADVFIFFLNVLIFSNINIDEFLLSVENKIKINFERLMKNG